MKEMNEIKEIRINFPNAIKEQIGSLNKLYQMIQYQRELIEQRNYDRLFSTRDEKDQIVEVIKNQGENISHLQTKWYERRKDVPHSVHQKLNNLVDELSNKIQQVLIRENQNHCLLEQTRDLLDYEEEF